MGDDEIVAAAYEAARKRPSFATNFDAFMRANVVGSGSLDICTLLYSARTPLLKMYVEGWSREIGRLIRYGRNGREPTVPWAYEEASYKEPGELPAWIVRDVVDEIRRDVERVAEIWACMSIGDEMCVVVVNEDRVYDVLGARPADDSILHRLEVVEPRDVDTAAIAAFAGEHVADAIRYFDAPDGGYASNSARESNGVRAFTLRRGVLLSGAPLALTSFLTRALRHAGWVAPRSIRLFKRLYLALARRSVLTMTSAASHMAELAARPGSLATAGAMGRSYGNRGTFPFASHEDCMRSGEYASNRHLRRFAEEFNKARELPAPPPGDDAEWRARVCDGLTGPFV
jgi:hypothetical protein